MTRIIRHAKYLAVTQPMTMRYGIDGLLAMGALSLANNNNNLFALRLGADEFQLSMLQFLPQSLYLLLLIPAGFLIDSLRNKRLILSIALFVSGIFYLIVSSSPLWSAHNVYFFLASIALASTGFNISSLTWQAYFPEAVKETERNGVLTFRTIMTTIVALAVPLIVGGVLAAMPSNSKKIIIHQSSYIIATILLIINALYVRRIKPYSPAPPKRISFEEIKRASIRLLGNKPFILFTVVILFFHMTWHIDWTLYFIGQATYLKLNEFQLGLTSVGVQVVQLFTFQFWSRRNNSIGVELPLVFGMLGLAMCPIAMITALNVPDGFGTLTFLALNALAHVAFATISLNIFQCLLKVVDREHRSFFISVYTCLIALSNAVLPVVGVTMYRMLGNNVSGLINAFWIVFALRIMSSGLYCLYLRRYRRISTNFEVS